MRVNEIADTLGTKNHCRPLRQVLARGITLCSAARRLFLSAQT
jgi:hypothetical protein